MLPAVAEVKSWTKTMNPFDCLSTELDNTMSLPILQWRKRVASWLRRFLIFTCGGNNTGSVSLLDRREWDFWTVLGYLVGAWWESDNGVILS